MNINVFRLSDSYCHFCEGTRLAGTQSKDPELYQNNGLRLQFTPHLDTGMGVGNDKLHYVIVRAIGTVIHNSKTVSFSKAKYTGSKYGRQSEI